VAKRKGFIKKAQGLHKKVFGKKLTNIEKKVGRKASRIGAVAVPIVLGVAFGPLGALAGTAIGAGLSQVHQKNDSKGKKRARLKRSLIAGGASIAGATTLALTGVTQGATGGLLSTVTNLFKSTPKAPGAADGGFVTNYDQLGLTPTGSPGQSSDHGGLFESVLGKAADVFGKPKTDPTREGWDPMHPFGKDGGGQEGGGSVVDDVKRALGLDNGQPEEKPPTIPPVLMWGGVAVGAYMVYRIFFRRKR